MNLSGFVIYNPNRKMIRAFAPTQWSNGWTDESVSNISSCFFIFDFPFFISVLWKNCYMEQIMCGNTCLQWKHKHWV